MSYLVSIQAVFLLVRIVIKFNNHYYNIIISTIRSKPNMRVNYLWQIRLPRFKPHLSVYRHYSPPSAVFPC